MFYIHAILVIVFSISISDAQIPCSEKCYSLEKFESGFSMDEFYLEKKWESESHQFRLKHIAHSGKCNDVLILLAKFTPRSGYPTSDTIFIINGDYGETINVIPTATFYINHYNTFVVADIDNDGNLEVIIASLNENYNSPELSRRLICYDLEGNIRWISDEPFGENNSNGSFTRYGGLAIADFNGDGIPEVYIHNKIYNAQTGTLLIDGGSNGKGINNYSYSYTIAVDIDPNSQGLELAAGYTIYNVEINNPYGQDGNLLIARNLAINGSYYDGYTSVADINGDGKLDVIVASLSPTIGLYCYTLNDEGDLVLLDYAARSYPFKYRILSPVLIEQMEPNGNKEMIFYSTRNGVHGYFFMEYDVIDGLTEKRFIPTVDQFNNSSYPSTFDFNNDGYKEFIYINNRNINIAEFKDINIFTLNQELCQNNYSFTSWDINVINDNPILLIYCTNDGPRLTAFGPPEGQKWPPVRSVRHQYAYNPLFINNDMTVPQEMPDMVTNKNGKYNKFMVQETLIDENGNYPAAAASVSGEITCVNYDEHTDSYILQFFLHNREEASKEAATGMPVAFYSDDPQTGGTLLGVYHTDEDIEAGSYINGLSLQIPATPIDRIWMVVNTDRSELILTDSSHYALSECDYTDNVHVMYELPQIERNTAEICEGESYEFYGMIPVASGRYVHRVLNSRHCDSVVSVLELEITDTKREQISISACDEYSWQGVTYTQTGMYDYQTESAIGCDSIVTLDLSINPSYHQTTHESSCEQYEWQGTVYDQSGSYLLALETSGGCDSLLRLELTIHPAYESVIQISSCESYDWQGVTYTESGTYQYMGQTAAGCDSIAILELEIVPVLYASESVTHCGSYEWNGTLYTESGSYVYESLSVNGCDSITTLELTLYQSDMLTETATACDSYAWSGSEYSESGSYEYITQNRYGCDSIVVLHLTIDNSTAQTQTIEACDVYRWNGTEYTESGSYLYTGLTSAGCDSTVVLELRIQESITQTEEVIACGRHEWQGQIYHESGSYSYTGRSIHGCDSTVVLELTIHPEYNSILSLEGCEELEYGGTVYTEPGIYEQSYTSAMGCDSLVVLEVQLRSERHEESVKACDSYTWVSNGASYTESGTYTEHYSNKYGCDSIEQLHLEIYPSYRIEERVDACGSYILPATGEELTESGIYTLRYETVHGCDSLRILDIHIHPEYSLRDTVISPSAYRWPVTIMTYEESGEYSAAFETELGCDSVHVLYLTIRAGTELYYANILRPEVGTDRFRIYSQDRGMEIISLGIYDRWGQQVYRIENIRANEGDWGWDGSYQGRSVVPGVYVWIAKLRYSDDSTGTVSGDVTVVR